MNVENCLNNLLFTFNNLLLFVYLLVFTIRCLQFNIKIIKKVFRLNID